MQFDQFGDDSDPPLLFVLGWGNQPQHTPVRWLIDRLAADGWHVHTATLPVHVTDVGEQWVRPVEAYAAALDTPALMGHSAGGLTAAHADIDAQTVTYLSPWWGDPPSRQAALVALLSRLPTDRKVLPAGLDDTRFLGKHATAEQLRAVPDRVSPRFLAAARSAHRTLPSPREDAVAFYSSDDRVVSPEAITERLPTAHLVCYEGAHELFSSRTRDHHLDTLLAVVENGPDGLSSAQ